MELLIVLPEFRSVDVGYLEINQVTTSQRETVYLFDKVLHSCDLKGTPHMSKPVSKVWISVRVGKTERKLLGLITVARMARMPRVYVFCMTGV